jgi:uncharacterized protein YcfJ
MKKSVLFCAAALSGLAAQAQEGRVLSSTPVIQQVAVPRQTCTQQPVMVEQPATSGAGSVIGAIAGGLLGNTIGHGSGRAAATAIGALGGALVGNRVESGPAYAQNLQQCTTQTYYENRTVAYNVTYEYAGQQHTVQMPHDPGPTVRLQVTPVGAIGAPGTAAAASIEQPLPAPQVSAPVQTIVAPAPVVVQSYPVYPAYPVYYQRPYHPPISLHFGYVHGGHRHHRHHWR